MATSSGALASRAVGGKSSDALALALCAALLGGCSFGLAFAWPNHDVAWYVFLVGSWLDGAVLYQDVIDTNPPLIVFLTAVPVLVGRTLHLSQTAAMNAFVLLLGAAAAAVAVRLTSGLVVTQLARVLMSVTIAFLLVPFAGADFGQREHLATILVTPFVLASAQPATANPLPLSWRLWLAAFAAAGFALKPHFVVAWVIVEVSLVALRGRPRVWFRPDAVAVAVCLALYLAIVLAFVPQYVPLAKQVAQVYGGLNQPASSLIRLPELQYWSLALLTLLLVRLPAARWRSAFVLFATATGFLVAGLSQSKGWGYHMYPGRTFVAMFFVVAVAAILDSYPAVVSAVRGGVRSILVVGLAVVTIVSGRYVRKAMLPPNLEQIRALDEVIRREQVDSLAMLSMRWLVTPAFPVVNHTGVRWVMRHHSLWFLPGLYGAELSNSSGQPRYRSIALMNELEREYFEHVVGDLCRLPPRLLGIDVASEQQNAPSRSLDLIGYYRQDERFSHLFAGYTRISARVGPFELYRRDEGAGCGVTPR